MMVAAGVIPWMLSVRLGVLWLLVSQLAVAPVYYMLLRFPLFEAVMQSLLYGGFSMFIFVTSLVARQQTEARDEQRRLIRSCAPPGPCWPRVRGSTSAPHFARAA